MTATSEHPDNTPDARVSAADRVLIGGEETEEDMGDKVVHSIHSGRFSYRMNRFVDKLFAGVLSCFASCFTTTAYTLIFISRVCISIILIYYTTVIITIIPIIICSRMITIII